MASTPTLQLPRTQNPKAKISQDRIAPQKNTQDTQKKGGTIANIEKVPATHITFVFVAPFCASFAAIPFCSYPCAFAALREIFCLTAGSSYVLQRVRKEGTMGAS